MEAGWTACSRMEGAGWMAGWMDGGHARPVGERRKAAVSHDAGTAASLGLSALLPKAAREEPMESKHPGQPQRPPPQQQPKMEPIKLSWLSAKAPVAAVPMKSMAEIQAEEEERADRVTQENLARIDQGIAPVALGESKDD